MISADQRRELRRRVRAAAGTAPSCPATPAPPSAGLSIIGVSKEPGRDRHHANAVTRELARDRQRHADDAALRRRCKPPVRSARRTPPPTPCSRSRRARPPRWARSCVIASAASRIMLNVPIRLIVIVRAKPASDARPSLPTIRLAVDDARAVDESMHAAEACRCAAATAACALASSVTSVRTKRAAARALSRAPALRLP